MAMPVHLDLKLFFYSPHSKVSQPYQVFKYFFFLFSHDCRSIIKHCARSSCKCTRSVRALLISQKYGYETINVALIPF